MDYILEAIVIGLTLSVMLGPIFITLLQGSLEAGTRGGLSVALGVWLSDISIIAFSFLFLSQLDGLFKDKYFVFWMGIVGCIILISFGVATILKKVKPLDLNKTKISSKSFFVYMTKGFIVNTINPFTFAFWLSILTTYLVVGDLSCDQAFIFFTAIIGVIIVTDIAKVLTAKKIRNYLNVSHLKTLNRVIGTFLIIFGIILLYKSINN